jgi:PAS domain S-box-containing protein
MIDNRHADSRAPELLSSGERGMSVIIADPSLADTPIIFASEQFEEKTGYPPREVLGRNCRFLQGPDTDPRAVQAIRDALSTGTAITIDILNYRKDRSSFWNRLRIRPVRDKQGLLKYYVGTQNPIPADSARRDPDQANPGFSSAPG